jgi:hypothetical protein
MGDRFSMFSHYDDVRTEVVELPKALLLELRSADLPHSLAIA